MHHECRVPYIDKRRDTKCCETRCWSLFDTCITPVVNWTLKKHWETNSWNLYGTCITPVEYYTLISVARLALEVSSMHASRPWRTEHWKSIEKFLRCMHQARRVLYIDKHRETRCWSLFDTWITPTENCPLKKRWGTNSWSLYGTCITRVKNFTLINSRDPLLKSLWYMHHARGELNIQEALRNQFMKSLRYMHHAVEY